MMRNKKTVATLFIMRIKHILSIKFLCIEWVF